MVRLRERYKVTRKEAKKEVTEAKNIAYKRMYKRQETKEWEHDMFKIAKARGRRRQDKIVKERERRRQDLQVVKFLKGEDGRVLVKEHGIKKRWQTYFHNLFSDQMAHQQESKNPTTQRQKWNNCYCRGITQGEVRTTLRKMGRVKAVGPNNIPIEVWMCLGEEGVQWLTSLFNLIFRPVNYRGPGRSTTEAIHTLIRLMEKHREKKRDLHMVFIDHETSYNSVPRRLIWDSLECREVPGKYVDIIRDMYVRSETSVKALVGDTDFFSVKVGLHQGSVLSPFLFIVVLDELSKLIQETIPWCMLFADDIVLVVKTKQSLNVILEEWHTALEGKGEGDDTQITIDAQGVPQVTKFKYLGSFVQRDGEIDCDVAHRIQAGWCRWRAAIGVLCDKRLPTKLKRKFYRVAIRPARMYATNCWPIKKVQTRKMEVAKMRMLRWMCAHTRLERIEMRTVGKG
ncbi:uncharacterized protein LOC110924406 [Helianthus annuus]|uniref:uncharacterized protein LOC110924406 n=1 Tax=Helianthus annuus TaxID=4232 RepID=UPI000B8F0228|nr:uncharacterized protein LOC110924406 [Helianthus annuus]